MPPKAVHVIVRGRVQGVGFRAWTRHQAELRSLSGWVRNLGDGGVEIVFAGAPDAVDMMLKACGAGPMMARVDSMEVADTDPASAGEGAFEERPTA
ncbi:acylphosphatase [Salinarimonas soli]|uniref:Acylphosphatase n=1 Tax=Salinarimonas soli TaxID=1638099 RepID=A0A5B2VIM2_9HYPH|nr:acylphosphatase [Salinarimonas soli]KAA2238212.1 acylphosphatase [Salinarimonas soli]